MPERRVRGDARERVRAAALEREAERLDGRRLARPARAASATRRATIGSAARTVPRAAAAAGERHELDAVRALRSAAAASAAESSSRPISTRRGDVRVRREAQQDALDARAFERPTRGPSSRGRPRRRRDARRATCSAATHAAACSGSTSTWLRNPQRPSPR